MLAMGNRHAGTRLASEAVAKTNCVTFPRSGHTLLVNILLRYFAADASFPVIDSEDVCRHVIRAGVLSYCEFYFHCKQTPCIDESTNLQKNHDFSLKLKISPWANYIVQYRFPLESIVSWYKFELDSGLIDDSAANWRRFAWAKIEFWRNFARKWLIDYPFSNALPIDYHDLIYRVRQTAIEAIQFISANTTINETLLKAVIDSLNIRPKNKMTDFKYYDPVFFDALVQEVRQEIEILNMKSPDIAE